MYDLHWNSKRPGATDFRNVNLKKPKSKKNNTSNILMVIERPNSVLGAEASLFLITCARTHASIHRNQLISMGER